jgi:DNA repair protein RadC
MKLKDLTPDDRPRERLLLSGARSLSNSELIAIIIGGGIGGKNVTEVARELLSMAEGSLMLLASMPVERLITQKGIGPARAIMVAAALELGRRSMQESNSINNSPLTSPELVVQLMLPVLRNLQHEECWALFLNAKNRLIGKEILSTGSLESTVMDTRKVLRRAIEKQSRHVIMVHNHPSGSPEPSEADIRQTDILRKALSAVEIDLLDHIIIGDHKFYSFSQERFG